MLVQVLVAVTAAMMEDLRSYGFFSRPADTQRLPDYAAVVRTPMDLGTVRPRPGPTGGGGGRHVGGRAAAASRFAARGLVPRWRRRRSGYSTVGLSLDGGADC